MGLLRIFKKKQNEILERKNSRNQAKSKLVEAPLKILVMKKKLGN